jgi:hypothetical protein
METKRQELPGQIPTVELVAIICVCAAVCLLLVYADPGPDFVELAQQTRARREARLGAYSDMFEMLREIGIEVVFVHEKGNDESKFPVDILWIQDPRGNSSLFKIEHIVADRRRLSDILKLDKLQTDVMKRRWDVFQHPNPL